MKNRRKKLHIAIDGPVAAGKSTTAKLLAKRLNILYVYTGAMYRAVAYLGLTQGLNLKEAKPLVELLRKAKIQLLPSSRKDRICTVLLDGKDVTAKLFTPRVSWGSSQVAIFPEIRKELVQRQQEIAQSRSVIMEGRDIASRVLPDANLKIYMKAALPVRVRRRFAELRKQKVKTTLEAVTAAIKKRDDQDTHRKADPLRKVKNAWVLDTTRMTIEEEIEAIVEKLRQERLIPARLADSDKTNKAKGRTETRVH